MASNHIEIGNAPRLAGEVRFCVDSLQAVVNKVNELYAEMVEFSSDWTALGAQLNLSDTEAQEVYANFVNARGVLIGADILYFLNRMS
jgi:hypothetical protein